MFITTLSINVGRSRANRSLVMDVFSFVDLLFIVDPPHKADGGGVVHEHVDFDLFSFVQASGVEVFVRSSLSGLFLVDLHDMVTCVVMYEGVGREGESAVFMFLPIRESWNGQLANRHGMLVISSWAISMQDTTTGTRNRGLAVCIYLTVTACG